MKRIDLTGRRFDKLTVVAEIGRTKHRKVLWLCVCVCGNHITKTTLELCHSPHRTKGCRECAAKVIGAHHRIHGDSRERLYWVWKGMWSRCTSPTNRMFRWYGAKGITVSTVWEEYANFKRWALANGYARGLTIDRIDPSNHYGPGNCHWITREENTRLMNEWKRQHVG